MEKMYITADQLDYMISQIGMKPSANELLESRFIKTGQDIFEIVITKIGKIESTIKLEE